MKKITYFTLMSLTIILISSCTIHFPYDYEITGRQHKIVFTVIPEDALLLLNGKFIGEAYEFSSWDSALTLSSKNNEIIVKREGYIEEVVDLYEYSGREFEVKVILKKDNEYRPTRKIIRKKELMQKDKEKNKVDKGIPVRAKEIDKLDLRPERDKIVLHKSLLSLSITPPEAAIYINDKFWGISPKTGKINNIVLRTGKYSLEIMKPGYESVVKKIVVQGKMKNLEMVISLKKK